MHSAKKEERRKKGGELTLEDLRVRVTLEGDEGPLPPATGGRGAPNPTPEAEQSGEKRPVPATPGASGADKSNEKAKKRRLNSHSTCLQAAGSEVKLPEEG